jgi:hypothetical protein
LKPLTYLLVDFENLQPPAQDIARVRGDDYRLWVFHGPHQNKFAAEIVVAWQPLGDRVRFVQSAKSGKNALDFHIAFCLGQAQQKNASESRPARYIVVSKDSGFDSLFDYMKTLRCAVGKAHSIPEALALAKSLMPGPAADGCERSQTVSFTPLASAQVALEMVSTAAPAPAKSVAKPKAAPQTKKAAAKPAALRTEMTADDVKKAIADFLAHPTNRPGDREALQRHIMTKLGKKVTDQVILAVIDELELQGVLRFIESCVNNVPPSRRTE